MNDISFKIKLVTKYINRYLRRDTRVKDWNFSFNHDSIDVQIDYIDGYESLCFHQKSKISFAELSTIEIDHIMCFVDYFIKDMNYRYEDKIIFEKRGVE